MTNMHDLCQSKFDSLRALGPQRCAESPEKTKVFSRSFSIMHVSTFPLFSWFCFRLAGPFFCVSL
jgi:hypothetical protein